MSKTSYLWDADNILAAYGGDGAREVLYNFELRRYGELVSDTLDESPTGSRQYHFDALGSTVNMTDASQNSIGSARYGAFGTMINGLSQVDSVFQYEGRIGYLQCHLTNLSYARRRDYSSDLGRWTSKDTIDVLGASRNVYWFNRNSPLNRVDYNGELDEVMLSSHSGACASYAVRFAWTTESGEADGFIIQKVSEWTRARTCTSPTGRPNRCRIPESLQERFDALKSAGLLNTGRSCGEGIDYYELWEVDAQGRVFARAPVPGQVPPDQGVYEEGDLFISFGFMGQTKGVTEKAGVALFVKRDELSARETASINNLFRQGNSGGVPNAGTLRSTCAGSAVNTLFAALLSRLSPLRFTSKTVKKRWSCCGLRGTWTLQTTYNAGLVASGEFDYEYEFATSEDLVGSVFIIPNCWDCPP